MTLMTPTITPLHKGDYSVEFFRRGRAQFVIRTIHKRPHYKRGEFARAFYLKLEKKWGRAEVQQLKADVRELLSHLSTTRN